MVEIRVGGRSKYRPAGVIARLAGRQHGVVSRAQLLAAGVSASAIQRMVASGWLRPLHRGVYAVAGIQIGQLGRWMTAVLAGGSEAMLSHRSAAELWNLIEPIEGPIHVTVRHGRRGPTGMLFHRSRDLGDRAAWKWIPATSPTRTLLDLAAKVGPRSLTRAFEEAERLGLLDRAELARACERATGRRGIGALRRMIATPSLPLSETRSELERMFLRYCRDRGLPIPAVNVPLAGHEVDCLWPDQRVAVELDSWSHHGGRESFERDRRRDSRIQRAENHVVRVTKQRMTRDGDELEADLRGLLGLAG